MSALLLSLLLACAPETTDDPPVDTDTIEESDPPEATDFWSIDDDVRTPLYGSLNCQMAGDRLYLNGAETNGSGSLQLQLGDLPTADGTYAVTSDPPAAGQAYLSIGLDREQDNQYVASGGVVEVVVVASPRAIELTFTDLPSTTGAGASAALSGAVGAREGQFVGACDFDAL